MRIEVTLREESGSDEAIALMLCSFRVDGAVPRRWIRAHVGAPGRYGGPFEVTVPAEPVATAGDRLADAIRTQMRAIADQAASKIKLAVAAIEHFHPEELKP